MLMESMPQMQSHPAQRTQAPPVAGLKRVAAAALQQAADALQSLAVTLAQVPVRKAPLSALPVIEFYAEAGAPEGALYADGQLVAHLPGVLRL